MSVSLGGLKYLKGYSEELLHNSCLTKSGEALCVNNYSTSVRQLQVLKQTLLLTQQVTGRINTRVGFAAKIKLILLLSSYC